MTKSNTLYVSGLDITLVEANLREEFAKHCEVDRVTVIRDKVTRVSKGFAYIVCKTDSDATTAMKEMDGKVLMERPIKVKYSHSETPEWVGILNDRGALKEESSPTMPNMFRGRGGRGGPGGFSRGGRGGPMRGGPHMRGGPMRGRGGYARGGYGAANGDSPRTAPYGRGRDGPPRGRDGPPRGRDGPPVGGRDAPYRGGDRDAPYRGGDRDAPMRGGDRFQSREDPAYGRESRGRGGPPYGQTGRGRGQSGPPRGRGSAMHGQGGPPPRDRGYLGYGESDGYDMGGLDRGEPVRRRPQLDERSDRPPLRSAAPSDRYEDSYSAGALKDPYAERLPARSAADAYPERGGYDDGFERRQRQDPYDDYNRQPPRAAVDRREPERSRQVDNYPPRDSYRERSPIRRDQYVDDPYAQKSSHIDSSYRPEAAARPAPRGRDPYAAAAPPVSRNDFDRRPEIDRYGASADPYTARSADRAPPPQRSYAAAGDIYSTPSVRSAKEPAPRSGGRPFERAGGYGGY